MPGRDELGNAIAQALSGHRCASAWLGYGYVLFMGFSSELVPQRPDGRHPEPPYELQTSVAEWRVVEARGATCESEQVGAELAVAALIGRSVVRWRLIDRSGLEIEFDGGWTLDVRSSVAGDPDWSSDDEEWWFSAPDNSFVGVGSDGRIISGRMDQPSGGTSGAAPT